LTNRPAEHVTGEPTRVEWVGGLDTEWTVEVDPYAGTVTVNGEEYDVGELEEGPPIHAPPGGGGWP
jgi:hypothetical protein